MMNKPSLIVELIFNPNKNFIHSRRTRFLKPDRSGYTKVLYFVCVFETSGKSHPNPLPSRQNFFLTMTTEQLKDLKSRVTALRRYL